MVRIKPAKVSSATRVEPPCQKGHYLSAYLSVFKVYSHELIPGEIIAICKQKRDLSDSHSWLLVMLVAPQISLES